MDTPTSPLPRIGPSTTSPVGDMARRLRHHKGLSSDVSAPRDGACWATAKGARTNNAKMRMLVLRRIIAPPGIKLIEMRDATKLPLDHLLDRQSTAFCITSESRFGISTSGPCTLQKEECGDTPVPTLRPNFRISALPGFLPTEPDPHTAPRSLPARRCCRRPTC